MLNNSVVGGFNDEVYSLLISDGALVREVAQIILNSHFPQTIHEDILTAVGLVLMR
ncbi:hypothetical protein JOC73_002734 [Alkaliphilus hydrothermalis]|uniref:ScoMcrA-like DNA sulfur-binding domain-containing protein n=1 Tax=Alkaliphilus hydrothermalis TaxID=1482730 RepID=A0ABS2NT78_9FIRM|nr:hypothetical protein [Alkaliphilus hydrothermalis]MBM7616158.1 hypothetical protein [Alkaliphilus hydrothermalis]